jgi:endonuclease/exonuclease/phosphatase (EEP) superfamily protein YafD
VRRGRLGYCSNDSNGASLSGSATLSDRTKMKTLARKSAPWRALEPDAMNPRPASIRTDFARAIEAEHGSTWGSLLGQGACKKMEVGITPVALGLLLLLFVGLFGEWVPFADSVSVFRPQIAALTGVLGAVCLLFRKRILGALIIACAVAVQASAVAASAGRASENATAMSLYQKNLLGTGSSPRAIADDIRSTTPDFVTLQEISDHNLREVESLMTSYPAHVICRSGKVRGVALFSAHPLIPGTARCYSDLNLVLAQVDAGEHRVWVASLHLRWPFPYGQAYQSRRVADVLSALHGKIVIAGDFNMVPWGGSVARIARAVGGNTLGSAVNSFPAFEPLVPLAIDHVLLPSGARGTVESRPLLGSDHYGLLAWFEL